MTTAGTERTPSVLARLATSLSCMSSTITSQDGQAAAFTVSTASLQAGQPALNTSTFRLVAIFPSPSPASMQIGALLGIFHAGKCHRVSRDEMLRILDPFVERIVVPDDAG